MMRTSLLLGAAFLLAASPLAAQQEFRLEVKEHTLSNGLQVLVAERPAAGRVGARIFTRVDIASERPGIWGSAHMLEHSMFKGSRFIGTSDWRAETEIARRVEELAREVEDERNRLKDVCRARSLQVAGDVEPRCRHPRLDSLVTAYEAAVARQDEFTLGTDLMRVYQYAGGTNMTASTGTDWMKFDIDLPADKLELFMYVERSRLEHPVFRQFDPEREVVVQQIQGQFNRPEGKFERDLQTITYPAHPYGQPHWIADLEASQREDHWEIFYKYFIPQNTVIVVVGEIAAERVFRLAERYFGDWQPGRPSPRLRTIEPLPAGQRRLEASAAAGPTLAVNVRIPAVGHPDLPALDVLAAALTGTEGWLARELGELVARASVTAMVRKYPGHIAFRIDARSNEQLGALEEGLERVLRRIAAGELPQAEIEKAVAELRFRNVQNFEEIGASAVRIGAMHVIHDWRYLNELPRLWGEVTPERIAAVTHEYLAPERRVVGVLRREAPTGQAAWASPPRSEAAPGPDDDPALRPAGEMPRAASSATASSVRTPIGEEVALGDRIFVPPPLDAPPARVAAAVWWAPPWMADQGDRRFRGADIPDDFRELSFPRTTFRAPRAEEFRTTFANGLRAYVVRDAYLPILKVTALLDITPLEDPAGKEGLTELLVQMLRFGGTRDLAPAQVEERLASMQARLTTRVERNAAWIELTVPAAAARQAVGLLASLLAQPRFDEDAFRTHRERTAVQAGRATDSPLEVSARAFDAALYGEDHPMARRPTPASVGSIERADLLGMHQRAVTPSRIIFAVAGAVDPARVRGSIASAFGTSVRRGGSSTPRARQLPAASAPQGRQVVTVDRPGIPQGHIRLGHLGIAEHPEDAAALELMHYVLCGGGFGSRMMDLLRTRTGITAALFCELEPGIGVTNPYLWRFSGRPETLARGVELALQEIERIRRDGISSEELEAARTAYIEGYIPAAYDTPHKTAVRLAHHDLLGIYPYGRTQYLNFYPGGDPHLAALQRVSVEDANNAARRYLDPDNLVVTVVGPLDEIAAGASDSARRLLGLRGER
ncbi:hypothetical protein BH23GEM7_BH23GEM7_40650 [soil metagenome]